MKTFLIFTLIISFILSNTVALAQTTFNTVSPQNLDILAYQKTIALCSQINSLQDEGRVSWGMLSFAGAGLKSGAALWGKDILQMSGPTRTLIESDGYKAAIAECYEDELSQNAFTAAIISADAGGHILGFVAWMIPISYLSKLFLVSKWALAHPALVEAGAWGMGVVRKVTLASVAAYLGWDTYRQYEERKNSHQYVTQFNDRMVDTTRQELDDTYVRAQIELNKVNAEIARGVSNPAHLEFLLRKKKLLEDALATRNAPQKPEPADEDNNKNLTVPPK